MFDGDHTVRAVWPICASDRALWSLSGYRFSHFWVSCTRHSATWFPLPPKVQQPIVGQGLIIEASRSHSDTPHWVGLLWTSDQPVSRDYLTTHKHSQETDIHATGRIRTHNSSKRAAKDPRLGPRGPPGSALQHVRHRDARIDCLRTPILTIRTCQQAQRA
jgi:hypothetical protein